MQKRFISTNAAHVDKIVFRGEKVIEDAEVMFYDRFIIVAGEDKAPDFYNVDIIEALYGVSALQAPTNSNKPIHDSIWTL